MCASVNLPAFISPTTFSRRSRDTNWCGGTPTVARKRRAKWNGLMRARCARVTSDTRPRAVMRRIRGRSEAEMNSTCHGARAPSASKPAVADQPTLCDQRFSNSPSIWPTPFLPRGSGSRISSRVASSARRGLTCRSRYSANWLRRRTSWMAEREGFEPSVEFPLHTLSKRAPSTTRTSLRLFRISSLQASG